MEIKVPPLGESIKDASIAKWLKRVGETVAMDEPLVELETDKITVEINAPTAGVLESIAFEAGATVAVGTVVGKIKPGTLEARPLPSKEAPKAPILSPAAQKIAAEQQKDPATITGSGKDGRITKADVLASHPVPAVTSGAGREERVRMSRLRQRIAERLKESQNTAAILTTFNEVDMSHVMGLRAQYKESFEKAHGVRLGFMSFFTKAVLAALKKIPALNGEIDGDEIVYKHYYNIGVAVGTDQGLVVPVIKDADRLSFAQIEEAISSFGQKAKKGELTLNDLSGGTFTISNGGVYGSLLSTPILNPPQVGILGLHKIEDRPVVVDKTIQIRPMMYLALSYDHRLVDGKEAVTFLVLIKEYMEDPQRLLLDI